MIFWIWVLVTITRNTFIPTILHYPLFPPPSSLPPPPNYLHCRSHLVPILSTTTWHPSSTLPRPPPICTLYCPHPTLRWPSIILHRFYYSTPSSTTTALHPPPRSQHSLSHARSANILHPTAESECMLFFTTKWDYSYFRFKSMYTNFQSSIFIQVLIIYAGYA